MCAPCLSTSSASVITLEDFVSLVDINQVKPSLIDIYIRCSAGSIVITLSV